MHAPRLAIGALVVVAAFAAAAAFVRRRD
jgi:hypothetical protein